MTEVEFSTHSLQLFLALLQTGLSEYDEIEGIQWEWQSVDGAMTKAPFAKGATGPNATDRAKSGVKRSLSLMLLMLKPEQQGDRERETALPRPVARAVWLPPQLATDSKK